MHPLDLLKIKFQVTTSNPTSGVGQHMYFALREIQQSQGWRGLYRGLIPNIAGNASSWGLYFLLYVVIFPTPHLLSPQLQHAQEARVRRRHYAPALCRRVSHMLGPSKFARFDCTRSGAHRV